MNAAALLLSILPAVISVSVIEPVEGESYNGNWLPVRAIVENDDALPDSVRYSINGGPLVAVARECTDWYTYMGNDCHTGCSDSPAPHDDTVLWTAPVTGLIHEFPTPVIVEGIVYYPSNSGSDSLYALNAATGAVIWKYFVGATDDAVTVKDGLLWTASDSLFCLDALTGQRVWASAAADEAGSTPCVFGEHVYAARSNMAGVDTMTVSCFDAGTGVVIWENSFPGNPMSCMTIWNGMLFAASASSAPQSNMFALDAASGEIIWENSQAEDGYWDSSPVVVDSVIYICGQSGTVFAFDAFTGSEIWSLKISDPQITATPACHANSLFFAPELGDYYRLEAYFGDLIWTQQGEQHGSSAVADGLVFFGDPCNSNPDLAMVRALDTETGSEVWSYQFACTWVAGSPAVTDGVLYMPAHDGNLYAFGTGLKYTYSGDLVAETGGNQLIVTSFSDGYPVAADTVSFTVTQTGLVIPPCSELDLTASPNPFRSGTGISFRLSESGLTRAAVYDLSGRMVAILQDGSMEQGSHSLGWNGEGFDGEPVPSGLYICRLNCGRISETVGLCFLR